ncbi:MAG: amidohydrolase family protein, partial [Alphaproteobacteria bacterium]|nr:amidohydrolase family protein [Alphaproteobacteria bacterium]
CALSAKIQSGDATAGNAEDVFKMATVNGARAVGLDAGEIAEGKLADCILIDLNNHFLVPNYNLISNMVYAADSSCIDTVICNGRILMQNRHVDGEEEIIAEIKKLSEFFRN